MGIIIEALVVGIIVVVVGSIVGYSLSLLTKSDLPELCRNWNKFYIMEISLFLTGFITHILCEVTKLNQWYCKNGVACSKI